MKTPPTSAASTSTLPRSSLRSRIDGIGRRGRLAVRRSLRKLVVKNVIRVGGGAVRFLPAFRPRRYGIRVDRNRSYRDIRGKPHHLDVFYPAQLDEPAPIVFYVHGGGFSMLSKDTHWGMAMTFARRGFVVFNINYRLAPKHPFPAPLEDVCAAYEWMLDNAERYGGDSRRVVFAGESAGANLVTALTIATTFERSEPYARRVFERNLVPLAVVPACGIFQVSDIDRFARRRELPAWIRMMLADISSGYLGELDVMPSADNELADPVRVFESDARPARDLPPFFLPVGTRDPLLDDTRRLEAALTGRGVPCTARYYPGEIHAFHAMIWRENARECWQEKFAFLDSVTSAALVAA